MAYLTGTASSIGDFLSQISTFLVNQGWALLDNLSPEDKVFTSDVVNLRLSRSGNNVIITCYQWWDADAHVGYNAAVGGILVSDGGFSFHAWTDELALVVAALVEGSFVGSYAGLTSRPHRALLLSIEDVEVGTDVPVPLSGQPPWAPGDKVVLLDQSGVNADGSSIPISHVEVKEVGASFIVADLLHNHAAGALVGVDPQPVGVSEPGIIGDTAFHMVNGLLDYPGGSGFVYGYHKPFEDLGDFVNPDDRSQNLFCTDFGIQQGSDFRGLLRGLSFTPKTGVQAGSTTRVGDVDHIALPITTKDRLVVFSTQLASFLAATTEDVTAAVVGAPLAPGEMVATTEGPSVSVLGVPVAVGTLTATTEDVSASFTGEQVILGNVLTTEAGAPLTTETGAPLEVE